MAAHVLFFAGYLRACANLLFYKYTLCLTPSGDIHISYLCYNKRKNSILNILEFFSLISFYDGFFFLFLIQFPLHSSSLPIFSSRIYKPTFFFFHFFHYGFSTPLFSLPKIRVVGEIFFFFFRTPAQVATIPNTK